MSDELTPEQSANLDKLCNSLLDRLRFELNAWSQEYNHPPISISMMVVGQLIGSTCAQEKDPIKGRLISEIAKNSIDVTLKSMQK
jgi:hypothetical protein